MAHSGDFDFARANFQPAAFYPLQSGVNFCADFAWQNYLFRTKTGNNAYSGFQVEVRRCRLTEYQAKKFRDGILGFERR